MMESVKKNHVSDALHETPTVCGTPGTPHGMDDDLGAEYDAPSSLCNRAPSTQRVINKVKAMKEVQMCIRHSPIFDDTNQHLLFQVGFWEEINKKLVKALSACAVTVEKGAKKSCNLVCQGTRAHRCSCCEHDQSRGILLSILFP